MIARGLVVTVRFAEGEDRMPGEVAGTCSLPPKPKKERPSASLRCALGGIAVLAEPRSNSRLRRSD